MKWGFGTINGDIVMCDTLEEATELKEALGIECSPIHHNKDEGTLYKYLETAMMDGNTKRRLIHEEAISMGTVVA